MGGANGPARDWRLRVVVVALLVLGCGALGAYFHLVLQTDIVYTHVAYVPIVLAGMWWGRRGVWVAGLLGAIVFSFHLIGITDGPAIWHDAARIALFGVVVVSIGELSEKAKGIQKALRQSEAKHRLIIEKSLTGIFIYRDERILFANAPTSRMVGYARSELVGKSIWDLVHGGDTGRVREGLDRRRREGFTDLHYECRLVKKDGTTMWADVASSVADYEGASAVLVNFYDITERTEAQTQRRQLSELAEKQEEQLVHSTRLAELGEMAAGVAHELNQPLTGIRNFARNAFYMLEKGVGTPEEIKDNLRLISEQVDRASKIINQMRELTRRTERQFTSVDINSTIRESVDFLRPQLRLSGVGLEMTLAEDLPAVMGDRIRLAQVFLNLLTNARQAMEQTEQRRLTVTSRLDGASDCPVVVEIADTGKGFPQEDAQKIFAPFFSTKKAGHGTGLGLSISLSIVRDHGGTIEATGEPGRGATFTLRLPGVSDQQTREAGIGHDQRA